MFHSTITKKGQTTIPGEVRKALGLKPGDRLKYEVQGDAVVIRVHPGLMSLKGILKSDKGRGMTFEEIRAAAAAEKVREMANERSKTR